jgi:hypothetical protein
MIGVSQNQYVSVSVAAPAISRQVPNTLIAASILSMIQPLSKRSLRKNQADIRIVMAPTCQRQCRISEMARQPPR